MSHFNALPIFHQFLNTYLFINLFFQSITFLSHNNISVKWSIVPILATISLNYSFLISRNTSRFDAFEAMEGTIQRKWGEAKLNGLLAGIEPWLWSRTAVSWKRLQEDGRRGSLAADSWQDKAGLFFLPSLSLSPFFSPPSSVVHELKISVAGLDVNRQSKPGKRDIVIIVRYQRIPPFPPC